MMMTVEIADLEAGTPLLAPVGMTSPYDAIEAFSVSGGSVKEILCESELGLGAADIRAKGGPLRLRYRVGAPPETAQYPDAMFLRRTNRFTRAAEDLAEASRDIARKADGSLGGIAALVAEAESRFAYAHPDIRFNDGMESVPYLSCGLTEGSCMDINTYLVASLRAAGFEAGYIYGYFFPQASGGVTHDMHCWVVTRYGGHVLEWDIAHHMKAGLGATRPGLNPRPGRRVALGHSMGHLYRGEGPETFLKLLSEPVARIEGAYRRLPLVITLEDPVAGGDGAELS